MTAAGVLREWKLRSPPLHQPLGVHTKQNLRKGVRVPSLRGAERLVGMLPDEDVQSWRRVRLQ